MKRYRIQIKLLSDLCVSDGSVYNSLLDTDVCYDHYGFPYIPAKRLRGCLRECALELKEWGDKVIDPDQLFGKAGDGDKDNATHVSFFRIGNAYLNNYQELHRFVTENQGHVVVHPQNILNHFSYIRRQTAIDQETGTADEKSLRSIRVIDKGLVFYADVEAPDLTYEAPLQRCCRVFRHMGLARTRGLGEVHVSLDTAPTEAENRIDQKPLEDGATALSYSVELIEPIISQSADGGLFQRIDYIEGSKILGLLSEYVDNYSEYISEGNLICTNAYPECNGKRYTEVPGYIYKIKNDKTRFVNKLYSDADGQNELQDKQINQMKHCYVAQNERELDILDVIMEQRYHHRRPEDKSIGRAVSNGEGESDFYQIDSIAEGQFYTGMIFGGVEQIKQAYKIITDHADTVLGTARMSEYGKVRICITNTWERHDNKRRVTDFVVELVSPTICYSDKAVATTDVKALTEEIHAQLGICGEPSEVYLRYTTISGFNVTWGKRKPTISVFDKGTAIRFHADDGIEIAEDGRIFLGERTAEGYGEAFVRELDLNGQMIGSIKQDSEAGDQREISSSSEFAKTLTMHLFYPYLRQQAIGIASGLFKQEEAKATISNLLQMTKEFQNIDQIKAAADQRFSKKSDKKQEKKKIADSVLEKVEKEITAIRCGFTEKYRVKDFELDENATKILLLKEVLAQGKYLLREKGDKK